jgi:hypothetical protein
MNLVTALAELPPRLLKTSLPFRGRKKGSDNVFTKSYQQLFLSQEQRDN